MLEAFGSVSCSVCGVTHRWSHIIATSWERSPQINICHRAFICKNSTVLKKGKPKMSHVKATLWALIILPIDRDATLLYALAVVLGYKL